MITTTAKREVDIFGVKDQAYFAVNQKDMPYIMHILRDELYGNKILAFIREYSTNAYDANVENGKADHPITVTLPNPLSPVFKIRDYGTGLTFEELKEVYIKYGNSTKRNTNDQVGMLGFGSKSAFAYGPAFTITSYCNGTKIICEAHIDETDQGVLNELISTDTDEENGIEISITIKQKDIFTVINTAGNFYKTFTPKPVFTNDDGSIVKIFNDYANRETLMSGDGWEVNQRIAYGNNSCVIMGNISYPISATDVTANYLSNAYLLLNSYNVTINMPIGSVQPTPSREALQYTNATKKIITSRIEEICEKIKENIQTHIDAADNMWDAYATINKFCGYGSLGGRLAADIYYRGVKLAHHQSNMAFDLYKKDMVNCTAEIRIYENFYGIYFKSNSADKIIPKDTAVVVINKGNFPRNQLSSRIRIIHNQNPNSVIYIIKFANPTKENIDEFFKIPYANELPCIDLSTVQVDSTIQKTNKNYTKKSNKSLARVFEFNRCNWEVSDETIKNGAGYYIPISSYEVVSEWCDSNATLYKIINFMDANNINVPTIYGIKTGYVDKLGANWKPFFEWIKPELSALINSQKMVNAYWDAFSLNDLYTFEKLNPISTELHPGDIKDLLDEIKIHGVNKMNSVCALDITSKLFIENMRLDPIFSKMGITIGEPSDGFHFKFSKIDAKYPGFKLMLRRCLPWQIDMDSDAVIEMVRYINILSDIYSKSPDLVSS